MARPFLTARWENLVLVNFECPPGLLVPRVPRGTELDRFDGSALVSLVAFMFRDTRVLGIPVPGHRNFEEVNLRFYVQRDAEENPRRGVVFIRELVPRWAVAAVARSLYHEPYRTASMTHAIALDAERGGRIAYGWRLNGGEFAIAAEVDGPAVETPPGSEAEFVTEHYRGYTRRRDGGTNEYRVEHPRWRTWRPDDVELTGPWRSLYGPELGAVIDRGPRSVVVAPGSRVAVHHGIRIADVNREETHG